jgi:SAM-dependent methyltransferase
MSHSVEKHLAIPVDDYDVAIRRFVPGYDVMLEEVTRVLRDHLEPGPRLLADLGAGTGRLAAHLLRTLPSARVVLVDVDREMLACAAERLASERERIDVVCDSFANAKALPRLDAAVASLSLHHVHDRDAKIAVYRNVLGALQPGGVLVTADAMVSAATELAAPLWRRWTAHLVEGGDTEDQARARFSDWAKEDRYYGVEEELDMMRAAGFASVDVAWRGCPTAVLVGAKKTADR